MPEPTATSSPVAESFGEDGEWMVVEGHHDPHDTAWAILSGYADLDCWERAAELVALAGGWSAFVKTLQFLHATTNDAHDWMALHRRPGPGSRPVTVLSFEQHRITVDAPQWPDWTQETPEPPMPADPSTHDDGSGTPTQPRAPR